ncbi:MAG: TonB-dependent receptor [Bacteroidales bacterium]|nr:TonB-dependent receptor [Bacteroidales bacterium]
MKIHGKNLSTALLSGVRAAAAVVCLLFCAGLGNPSWAQGGSREITGTVVDENNLPMPGVTVMVDGTTNGTMTTENGTFVLRNVPANSTLLISCIGYTTQRLEVGSRTNFSIKLVPDTEMLEETVVVAFGQQKKATVTGAIATVGSAELRKTTTTRLDNALAGRVTGLTSMQSGGGQPGRDGATMYLRGAATVNGQSPLILVDGVERSDGIRTLDMNEVENISVLKDASATGLYGVRGANGVILITTRRGQKGKPNLSITFDESMSAFTTDPERIHSWEYMALRNEALMNSGSPAAYSDEVIAKFKNPLFGLTGNEPNYAELKKMREYLYCDNDYYHMMFKKFSPQSRLSANLSGGTDKVNYFLNIGYIHQDGNLKNLSKKELGYDTQSYMNRFSLRSNLDFHLTKDFTLSLNLASYSEDINMPCVGAMYNGNDENWMMRDLIYQATCITPISVGPTTISEFGVDDGAVVTHSWMDRTAYEVMNYRGFRRDNKKNLNSTLSATYDLGRLITKGLSITGSVSYDTYNMGVLEGYKATQLYLPVVDYTNDTLQYAIHSQNPQPLGLSFPQRYSNYVIYGQASINYARRFADKHDVTAMVTGYRRYWEGNGGEIPYNLIGTAARLTYGYDDRYLAEVNMGYNGTEQFAPANRFGFFPSVSLGWIASNEAFLKDNKVITWLKFRYSYGMVGNDQQGGYRFLYQDDIRVGGNTGQGGTGLGGNTISEGLLGNKSLKWELAKKQNYAVEIGLFEDFRINFDYFTENRDQILISRKTIPTFQGLPLGNIPRVNMGVVENHGFEVELKYSHDFKNGYAFNINGNLGFNDNKVIEYDEVQRGEDYAYRYHTEGFRLGQQWGYLIDWDSPGKGYFTSQEEIDEFTKHTKYGSGVPRPGDFVYKDVTGDGVIDDKDVSPIGYSGSIPGLTFGLSMGAQLKNFDFSILFSGLGRYSKYYSGQNVVEYIYQGTYYGYHKNAWTPERWQNGEKITYPALSTGATVSHRANDFFIQNRSFVRLKNVEIGYNLPSKLLSGAGVKSLRIYASGQNLFYFTKCRFGQHLDPEVNDPIGYPITKNFLLGLNINF